MMQMQGMAGGWTKRWKIDKYFIYRGMKNLWENWHPQLTLTWHFSISEIPIGMLTNDDLWTLWKSWYSDVVANGRFNLSWIDNDLKDDINFPNHLLLTF